MNSHANSFDIIIIGAGSAGLGVALALLEDKATKNLKIAIFDRQQVARETSNNSLRIIHGGFRYLQSLDLFRSIQSASDQIYLANKYPDYIKPLPCLLGLKPWTLKTKIPLSLACLLYSSIYSILSKRICWIGSFLSTRSFLSLAPNLDNMYSHGAFQWKDYLLERPIEFAEKIKAELLAAGVHVFEKHNFVEARYQDGAWQSEFESNLGKKSIKAKLIINTSGPGLEKVACLMKHDLGVYKLNWMRVFNLVFKRNFTKEYGIAFDGNFGAMFFMTPRDNNNTAIGTFALPFAKNSELKLSEDEIAQSISKLNQSVPKLDLKREELVNIDLGLLPADSQSSELINKEQIFVLPGALHVLSIKYTTFISLGRNVVKKVKKIF